MGGVQSLTDGLGEDIGLLADRVGFPGRSDDERGMDAKLCSSNGDRSQHSFTQIHMQHGRPPKFVIFALVFGRKVSKGHV